MLIQDLPPIFPPAPVERQPHPRPWRKGSVFDLGGRFRRPIDRNERARIIARAELLERRTKRPGQRDGVIGQSALSILRVLLFHFLDPQSGRLDPSYKQMQEQTGFCMQTIAQALKRLERAGILEITRRMVRLRAQLWNALTGLWEWRDKVQQDTNAYRVNFPTPDRSEYGDLGMPLWKPPSDSTSQRESTPRFFHKRGAAEPREAWRAS